MEWQIVGYCLIPLSVVEAFASKQDKVSPHPILVSEREIPTPCNLILGGERERVCKMSFKSKGCNHCRLRSCCDLAERNARLFSQGKINAERFEELSDDLNNTCEIAFMYQNWLLSQVKSGNLPLTSKRFHTRFKERKKIVQTLV